MGDLVADASHGGELAGAARLGEAAEDGRVVRVGVWLEGRRVTRARFKASSCASLIAASEAACRLLEAGADPAELDAGALARALPGLHPGRLNRLELVARAVRAAAPAP